MTRVYLDTSFWLSAAITKDTNHAKTGPIMDKIRSGSYTALVSRHVLCEVLDVMRSKTAVHPKVRATGDSAAHRAIVEESYKKFVEKVLAMPNVRVRDSADPAAGVLEATLKLLKESWGGINRRTTCPACHGTYDFVEYDGPSRDDAMHLVIADRIRCEKLVTFDQGFVPFRDAPAFSHVAIEVM